MRTIYKIAKSELRILFYSPIAWLILTIFVFQVFGSFLGLLDWAVDSKLLNTVRPYQTFTLFIGGGMAPYTNVQNYLYLYIPLLTMGLISREYSSGSIKLLFSSPVSSIQIVLGKYLSMMIYGLIMMGSLLVIIIVAYFSIKDMDVPLVLSGLLGLYLLMCTYSAIGLFMSSLTSYQIVAALGTLTLISFLNLVGNQWQSIEGVRDVMHWFSIVGRANESVRGLICSEDIMYFVLVSAMFLSFSVLKLQFARRSSSMIEKVSKYVGLVVCVIVVGYITSRPSMMFFYDATANKDRTITPNSQEIVKQLDGDLTITSYVNLLDQNGYLGMPDNWANDLYAFESFIRFKPETKMKSVYFYDNIADGQMSREEMEKKIDDLVLTSNINPKKILTPEQIREKIDLSSEENRYVRVLEGENGQKAHIRMFNDQQRYPSEAEISAALKTMITKSPRIAFLTGHGERSIYEKNGTNYSLFTTQLNSRSALINQGYSPFELKLEEGGTISKDVDILVVADPQEALTADELSQINDFTERGGNLVIIGEARRNEFVAPVIAKLGLSFVPGVLVQPRDGYPANLLFTNFTAESGKLEYAFGRMRDLHRKVPMTSAAAIEVVEDKGFEITNFLETDATGCWNELESKSFSFEEPTLNSNLNEIEKTYTTGIALQRQVNGKEQRIFVLGDADCLSNGEFSLERDIATGNYPMVFQMFQWLVYDEFPIDISRPVATDNDIYLTPAAFSWLKLFLNWICPALLILSGALLWFLRRRR